ncbi:MAG: cytochrome c [Nitrospinae bacterium]|nr:cytochrome c [Nitrospinota bacterium]
MLRILLIFAAVILPMSVFIFMGKNQEARELVIPPGIELTDAEKEGKILFKQKGCQTCHSIFGTRGGYGPILDRVAKVRDEKYLHKWLFDPKSVRKTAKMPRIKLEHAEIDKLIAFLQWVNMVNEEVDKIEKKEQEQKKG